MMGGNFFNMGFGSGYGLWHIFTMAFWIIIIFLIIYGAIKLAIPNRSKTETNDPLQVLNYRYANGEIDRDEFEEKKKDLGYIKDNYKEK